LKIEELEETKAALSKQNQDQQKRNQVKISNAKSRHESLLQ